MTLAAYDRPVVDVEAPRPSVPRPSRSTLAARALVALAAVTLGFVAFVTMASSVGYHRDQDVLYAQLRGELHHAVAPVTAPIPVGHPVALLSIPRLHLRAVVIDGTTSRELMRAPGHVRGTPLPGQPGTAVLLGRRSSFGSPLHALGTLRAGDVIDVTTGQGRFHYVVDLRWRSDHAHVEPGGTASRLDIGTGAERFAPTRTTWVGAHLVGSVAPAGRVDPVQPHAGALAIDPDAAITAYLWAQALLLLAYAAVRWRRRIPAVALWLGGAPLGVVLLWNVFDNLAALLPNVL